MVFALFVGMRFVILFAEKRLPPVFACTGEANRSVSDSLHKMLVTLTTLCTGCGDLDSEFVLESEEDKNGLFRGVIARCLFNVRDGTQRVCSEHSIRLSKLKTIFISRLAPDTLGGLPGRCSRICCSLQACYCQSTIWGCDSW